MKNKRRIRRKIKYTDEPLSLGVVKDNLPRPEDLVFKKERKTRVTIVLPKKKKRLIKL